MEAAIFLRQQIGPRKLFFLSNLLFVAVFPKWSFLE